VRHHHDVGDVELRGERGRVHLAHGAGELEVDAVAHADRPRGDVVPGDDADLGARHRRVRQALREEGLDLHAQHAGGVLHHRERLLVGDAKPMGVARAQAFRLHLRLDLRARPVHQHQPDLERGEQVDVVDEAFEARALGDHLAAERDDERAAAEIVHIRRDLAEPADEALGVLHV
jgi:hypothetical protein